MRLLTILIVFIIKSVTLSQDFNSVYVLIADTSYDFLSNTWVYNNATNLEYNSKGLLSERTIMRFENNSWINYYKYLYSYNINGQLQTLIVQSGQAVNWLNETKFEYEYTYDGKILTYYIYSWENNQWEYSQRNTYNYYSTGNVESSLTENWFSSDWIYYSLDNFYYNSQGYLEDRIYQVWNDTTISWKNHLKQVFDYDEYEREIELTSYDWMNSNWKTRNRTLKTYYNQTDLITEFKRELCQDSIWVNDYRYLNFYNINNLSLERLEQDWIGNNWGNVNRELYGYDVNNNQILLTYQNWISSNWETNGKKESFYQILTSFGNENTNIKNYLLLQNFPNPFNPITKISYELPKTSKVDLKIFNTLGQEVVSLVNEEKPAGYYEVEFNGSSLASGIYYFTLRAGDFIQTKKMILIK